MPEDLLEVIKVPVTIGWGDQDPWEPIEQGREFARFDIVEVGEVTARVFSLHPCLFYLCKCFRCSCVGAVFSCTNLVWWFFAITAVFMILS